MPFSIVFRTTDMDRWGTGKGANLVPLEVDENFWNLAEAIQDIIDNPVAPAEISDITLDETTMTVHLSNGNTYDVIVPVASFTWRGEWAAATAYETLDVFSVAGTGLYMVL